jgi:hypothetical protein
MIIIKDTKLINNYIIFIIVAKKTRGEVMANDKEKHYPQLLAS